MMIGLLMGMLLAMPRPGNVIMTHDVFFLPDSNSGATHRPASRASVVLLVRHADKAPSTSLDPPLSQAGRARSAGLADALRDAGVTRIVVDQSQRTQETAMPLSQRLTLRPDVMPIDWSDPTSQVRAIADSVRRHGAVTLVIGHRNTIPAIIRALGGPVIPEIREGDYNDLYMIVLDAGSAAPVFVHSTYRGTARAE